MSEVPPGRDSELTQTSLGASPVLAAGKIIAGRYRIVALIGAGGMGMVYRAEDERLHLEVALKLLRPDKSPDPRMLERFEQELVLARQVTHRNVVRIHDIGRDGELHFLTMDFVDGHSLRHLLDEHQRLPAAEAARIARDLAEALAAAHQQSVVHRDLKPANVLVDKEGRACISDFGVARSLRRAGMTETGGIVGTLDYLAPEQARGEEVDGRTDIYALGLILFEMLSGQRAFRGESAEEVLAARSAGRPERLADTGVWVPEWLERVIERCLAADPAQRYQKAEELAADLASGSARRVPWLRGRRLAIAAGAAAAVAAAGLGWWYFAGRIAGPPPEATPTVAVLPFVVQSTNEGAAWLSTGLAEMLAQGLAESAGLQVAGSLRVLRTFEDLQLSPARLGKRDLERLGELLDATRLVTGTVREAGGTMRVELQLVDRRLPDDPPATLRGEAAASGLFALADRLTAGLRDALAIRSGAPAAPALSQDGEAMAAYARALGQLMKGDTVAAATACEEAVAEDPGFAAAWVQLARARNTLGYDDPALEAARRAVALLDQRSGRIGFEARSLAASLDGDFGQAQQVLTALLERYPHDLEARVALAEAYGEEGQLDRAQQELKAIVAASPNHPRASFLLGKFAILAGDYRSAAEDHLVRALVVQNRLGNLQGRADAENAMGIAQAELGNLDQARQRYQNAIDLRSQIGDERGVATATANVARIQLHQGQHDAARATLQQSLEIVERIGDRHTVANLHNEIGALEERQGRYREALERYRTSLAILRELGDQRALAESYNNVGFAYFQLGDFDNAGVYAGQSMQLYQKTGNREGQMFTGQTVGMLALARGEWNAAEKAMLEVLQLGREFEDRFTEGIALGQLGRIAHYRGHYGAAQASIRSGLAALAGLGEARALVELRLFEAELMLELAMAEAASAALAEAGKLLDESGSHEQRAEWQRLTAIAELHAGRNAQAKSAAESARTEAAASGSAVVRIAAGLGAAEAALAGGEGAAAATAATRLHAEARALGHVPLMLKSGELLARAQARAGRGTEAEKLLRATLREADGHAPWGGHYRLHAQLAALLEAGGRAAEAAAQRKAAADEVARLREGLDETQRASFERLREVMEIATGKRQAA